jgi:WD40-like Beta Propeller Repeat
MQLGQDWAGKLRILAIALLICCRVPSFPVRGQSSGASATEKQPPYHVKGKVTAPRIFAEGIISTVDDEIGGAFSPDGNEFYFTRLIPYTTFPRLGVMCVSYYRDGRWSTPQVLPFSGKYLDYPPKFDPTGERMLFASSRPLPDGTRGSIRIWKVERSAAGWGEPRPLPPPINAPGSSWNADPALANDGTLYFSSDRGGSQTIHLYRARLVNGQYTEPEKLWPEIKSDLNDYQPFVATATSCWKVSLLTLIAGRSSRSSKQRTARLPSSVNS